MQDPKKIAWAYLIVGLIAIVGVSIFLYIDYTTGPTDMALLDWAFLAISGYSVYRGIKGLRELGDGSGPPGQS